MKIQCPVERRISRGSVNEQPGRSPRAMSIETMLQKMRKEGEAGNPRDGSRVKWGIREVQNCT